MPFSQLTIQDSDPELRQALSALREEFDLPESFSPEVLAEAEQAVRDARLPGLGAPGRDARELPLVTIDPPDSMDLDQAMALSRTEDGYLVRYAIADVQVFVHPGGAIDAETRRRGQTLYLPDGRIPLHPPRLSEDAGSLLPGQGRPAYLWEIVLDADGRQLSATVARAAVRSIAKLSYAQAQQDIESETASEYLETLLLLREIGLKRIELERERGGASLNTPQQHIERTERGYRLVAHPNLPIEDWNAQISLLTGMAAAQIMLAGGIGILRTMPEPDTAAVKQFRLQARALGAPWPAGLAYGEFLRTLNPENPQHLALLHAATSLFRGAGYTPFDGAAPEQPEQAAVAAPYTHTTAPLRRLVDRFVLVICAALCAGEEVPAWVREALPELPELMAMSGQLAGKVNRAGLDLMEAAVLADLVGQEFEAVLVSVTPDRGSSSQTDSTRRGTVQLLSPAVTAPCELPTAAPGVEEIAPGSTGRVELLCADIDQRAVRFRWIADNSKDSATTQETVR